MTSYKMIEIDISGLDPAEVLAALYNRAKPVGMGLFHFIPEPITKEQAQSVIDHMGLDFDYLQGRRLKFSLKNSRFRSYEYDEQYGEGTAAAEIQKIRDKEATPSQTTTVSAGHKKNGPAP